MDRSELDRIVFESIGFFCPGFTDGFERREPIQSLETLGEVRGRKVAAFVALISGREMRKNRSEDVLNTLNYLKIFERV